MVRRSVSVYYRRGGRGEAGGALSCVLAEAHGPAGLPAHWRQQEDSAGHRTTGQYCTQTHRLTDRNT